MGKILSKFHRLQITELQNKEAKFKFQDRGKTFHDLGKSN